MKRLMKWTPVMLGLDANNVIHIKNDLEKLGSVNVVTYISRFSLFFPDLGGVIESKSSDLDESNHIEIALNGAIAVQLFNRFWGFSGNFLDHNFSQSLREKIELILAKNGYYTGRMAWKYLPWIPLVLLSGIAVATLLLGLNILELLHSQDVSCLKLSLIGLNCVGAISFVYMYRHYFSTQRDGT